MVWSDMPNPMRKKVSRCHSKNPEDAAWRAQQSRVDSDIAGLARNPALEKLVDEWHAEGLSTTEVIKRLKAYFIARATKAGPAD